MKSEHPKVNELHSAYCAVTGLDLEMDMAQERLWYDAWKAGVTTNMLIHVVRHRQRRIREGVRRPESIRIRNLVGNDERIADLREDYAAIEALKRKQSFNPSKADVLRATGRDDEPPPKGAVSIYDAMRNAVAEEERKKK